MRTLGIDFGRKKIGLAISDENGRVAFPLRVIPNDEKFFSEIQSICKEEKVKNIVLGESLNFSGEPNPVMEKILAFKKRLEEKLSLSVSFEKEFLTSKQARNISDSGKMNDASAAAIILQSFLDRHLSK